MFLGTEAGGVDAALVNCTIVSNSTKALFTAFHDETHPLRLVNTAFVGNVNQSGDPMDWMTDAYDVRGGIADGKYKRLRDSKVDIGCYQCWLNPVGMILQVR